MNIITGTEDNDDLSGTENADFIEGLEGDDVINAGDGDDTLRGDQGADTVNGDNGDDSIAVTDTLDTIDGGAGYDTMALDFSTAKHQVGVNVDFRLLSSGGIGTLSSSLGSGTAIDIEYVKYIHGSSHRDRIWTSDTAQSVSAGGGDDHVVGGAADDYIDGSIGADRLWGNSGADQLVGDDGNDTLTGGAGADALSGGSGADTFAYLRVRDSRDKSIDTVTDFSAGTNGKGGFVLLDKFDFKFAVTALEAPVSASLSAASLGHDLKAALTDLGEHHAVVVDADDGGDLNGHTYLVVDANGIAGYQTKGDFLIDVTGSDVHQLSTANFI